MPNRCWRIVPPDCTHSISTSALGGRVDGFEAYLSKDRVLVLNKERPDIMTRISHPETLTRES